MKIIYHCSDMNCVRVVHRIATKEVVEKVLGPITDEEYKAHIWQVGVPESAVNPKWVEDNEIPDTMDEYFNAWVWDGNVVTHHLGKATDIALKKVRAIRDPLLVKYDGLQMRAIDIDAASLSDIKAKKAQLRAATDKLKALTPSSIDDIKAAIPDLGGF